MNIGDYLIWRGDIHVTVSPFNAVDALVLSHVIYSHFYGVGDGAGSLFRDAGPEAERHFPDELPRTVVASPDEVMLAAAATRRFGDCILCEYADEIDEDEEKQFAAAVFLTPDGAINVTYRGTDDSLVGWKEDFNLAFATPVPAQIRALDYLNRIARVYEGPIRVMGHSKGGNLAVYAAAFASPEVQARITDVYNNDGPGQDADTIGSAGYRAIFDRVHTFIPKSSIVGMLLEHTNVYEIIESDAVSVLQHDPKKWQVMPFGFVQAAGMTPGNLYMSDTIRLWLKNLSSDERRLVANSFFTVLEAAGTRTLSGIYNNPARTLPAMLAQLHGMDKEKLRMLREISRQFLLAAFRLKHVEASVELPTEAELTEASAEAEE